MIDDGADRPADQDVAPNADVGAGDGTACGIALAGQHAGHLQIARGTMHLCGLAGLHRDAALVVADGAVSAGNQLPVRCLGGVRIGWVASFTTVAQPLRAAMAMAAMTRCFMLPRRKAKRHQAGVAPRLWY
ncbi:hypothetical protein WAE31_12165 (plasmid) [Xanthomonas axonopodis pv. vasculorum]